VGDHKPQINQVCGTCHAQAELASTHQLTDTNCVACHMPKIRASDISHAAITDHRILKRPSDEPIHRQTDIGGNVVPWKNPESSLVNRDLGLALFNLARSGRPEGNYPEAFRLLAASASPAADAAVQAAEGYMLLGSGHAQAAIVCFSRAVSDNDQSPEYWLDLGVAQQAAADNTAAEHSFRESIRRNPADYRPYQALAALLKKEGQEGSAAQVTQQFLQIDPQSILMRLRPGN
jgi:tetratricopeptide (TPR) repeat protein